jgi:hypothetical protein
MSDFKWPLTHDAYLYLALAGSSGFGQTGETPQVAIRRVQDIDGTPSDGLYWSNSASFTAAVTFNDMTEVDATNNPGLYFYIFSQSFVAEERIYLVYFSSSLGFDIEKHVFTTSGSASPNDLRIYESED